MISLEQLQETYIQDLLRDLNAASWPEAEQREMVDLVVARFNNIIMTTLIRLLDNAQRARLEKVIGQPEQLEAAVTHLAAEVPNLHMVLEQALLAEYEALKLELS